MKKFLVLIVLASVLSDVVECRKGGSYRGGSSWKGRKTGLGSKTRVQAPKVGKPAISNARPNSPSIGFNTGGSKPNPKPSAPNSGGNPPPYSSISRPNGPPPAYPGLGPGQTANSRIYPPAYSPSNMNPPSYGFNGNPSYIGRQANYRPSYMNSNPSYSAGTMYVSNYNGRPRDNFVSSFFTSALWYNLGRYGSYNRAMNRRWDYEEEKKWRATTQGPYFENKVPGSEMVLPAAAVFSATTAFGLYTLLPLFVPVGKPLLFCNSTILHQVEISINDQIYFCNNGTLELACPLEEEEDDEENMSTTTEILETTTELETTTFEDTTYELETDMSCFNEKINCSEIEEYSRDFITCVNNTLIAKRQMICNSTLMKNEVGEFKNETRVILECIEGLLPMSERIMLRTKPPPTITEAPTTTTLSSMQKFKSSAYSFMMWSIGRPDLLDQKSTTTTTEGPIPEFWEIPYLSSNSVYDNEINNNTIQVPILSPEMSVVSEVATPTTNVEPDKEENSVLNTQ